MSVLGSTMEVVKGATIIAQVSDPTSSTMGPGTAYSIQMTECQTCTKNTATINTMLGVMQQQATTIKDQQATIASLITMLSNATGGSNSVKLQQIKRGGIFITPPIKTSVKRSHTKKPESGGIVTPKRKGDGSLPLSKKARQGTAASSAPKPRRVMNGDGQYSENSLPPQEFIVTHQKGGSDVDDELVTKIWIRGTPHEKCPCPLAECEGRKFAAADMYYLRRHFQQVHRLSHPNPMFVIQCPVEECGAEFETSLREMRKHLAKDHPDAYPSQSITKQEVSVDRELDPEHNGDGEQEDVDAAAELEEDGQ